MRPLLPLAHQAEAAAKTGEFRRRVAATDSAKSGGLAPERGSWAARARAGVAWSVVRCGSSWPRPCPPPSASPEHSCRIIPPFAPAATALPGAKLGRTRRRGDRGSCAGGKMREFEGAAATGFQTRSPARQAGRRADDPRQLAWRGVRG